MGRPVTPAGYVASVVSRRRFLEGAGAAVGSIAFSALNIVRAVPVAAAGRRRGYEFKHADNIEIYEVDGYCAVVLE